jgi:hypothetical protein
MRSTVAVLLIILNALLSHYALSFRLPVLKAAAAAAAYRWKPVCSYSRERTDEAVTEIAGPNTEAILQQIEQQFGIPTSTFRRATKERGKRHRFKGSELKEAMDPRDPFVPEKAASAEDQIENDLWAFYGRRRPKPRPSRAAAAPEQALHQLTDEQKAMQAANLERVRRILDENMNRTSRVGVRSKKILKIKTKLDREANLTGQLSTVERDAYRIRKPLLNLNKKEDRMELHKLLHTKKLRNRARIRLERAWSPCVFGAPLDMHSNETIYSPTTFVDAGVTDAVVLTNLQAMGFALPTKIQGILARSLCRVSHSAAAQAEGARCIVQAHTGSGKVCSLQYKL